MKNIVIASIFVMLVAVTSGCTHRITDFTVISSKNVDLSEIGKYQRGSDRVIGEDIAHIIIFIPTGIPNLKEAIDRAIEVVPGAVALVDGVVYRTDFYIPFLYGQAKYLVEGTPLIKPSDLSKLPSKNIVVSYNSDKNEFVVSYLNDSEFSSLKQELSKEEQS